MQNWISDDLFDDYLFAVSDTGYFNDEIHLDWAHHFNKYFARHQKGAWRLLLIDGYGTYMIYEFLHYCEENKIVVFGLIPHTTHFTQSLDVVVFEPFKHFHKQAVNEAVRTGCFKFDRTEFLHAINLIRRNTFKKKYNLVSLEKSGYFFYNPAIALSQLREWALYQERYQREQQPVIPIFPITPKSYTLTTPILLRQLAAQLRFFRNWEEFNFHPHYERRFNKIYKGAVLMGMQRKLFQNEFTKTEAAQKAREKRKKGGRKVIQREGLYM